MKAFIQGIAVFGVIVSTVPCAVGQGSLTPPSGAVDGSGNPVAVMKTLDQVEPRRQIDTIPFTITNAGSYYLSQTLVNTNALETNGITIAANNVILDLRGFALISTTTNGGGNGIATTYDVEGDWGSRFNVTVMNGVVRGWGGSGIYMGTAEESQITDMKVTDNVAYGIQIGPNSKIERCSVSRNGSCGIEIHSNGTVMDCKAQNNGEIGPWDEGIYATDGARIVGCSSSYNTQGIWVGQFAVVRDCTVLWNEENGIRVDSYCRIEANNCGYNSFGTNATDTAGIYVQGSGNRVDGNSVNGNYRGIDSASHIDSSGNLIIRNTAANNDMGGYSFSATDYFGQIQTGMTGGTYFSADPWSNFEF